MSATTLGFGSSATGVNSIAIGNGATTSTDNECVIGNSSTNLVTNYVTTSSGWRSNNDVGHMRIQSSGAIGTGVQELVFSLFHLGGCKISAKDSSNSLEIVCNSGGVRLVNTTTAWASNSDPRIKKNKKIVKNCCEKLSNIHAWNYDFLTDDTDDSSRIGLMTDEVLPYFPGAVSVGAGGDAKDAGGNDIKTDVLRYTQLIPPAIGAINELCTKLCSIKTVEIRDPTSTYIATEDDRMLMFDIDIDTTITLPDNALYKGRKLIVILAERTASQTLTIQRAGSDTIDDRVSTSTVLNALDARIQLVSGGNGVWYVL